MYKVVSMILTSILRVVGRAKALFVNLHFWNVALPLTVLPFNPMNTPNQITPRQFAWLCIGLMLALHLAAGIFCLIKL